MLYFVYSNYVVDSREWCLGTYRVNSRVSTQLNLRLVARSGKALKWFIVAPWQGDVTKPQVPVAGILVR